MVSTLMKQGLKSFNPLPVLAGIIVWIPIHGFTSLMRMSEDQWPTYAQWWAEVLEIRFEAVFWFATMLVVGIAMGIVSGANRTD